MTGKKRRTGSKRSGEDMGRKEGESWKEKENDRERMRERKGEEEEREREKGRKMVGEESERVGKRRVREGERLRSVWRKIKRADSGLGFGAANTK